MTTWSEVQCIDTREGKRGGEVWILTLSCGHVAVRAKPSKDPRRALRYLHRRPRFAPKRVKCLLCCPEVA